MYMVDKLDEVVELRNIPQMSPGAPLPTLVATDDQLMLAFELAGNDQCCLIEFIDPRVHYFGAPNDEALLGHPLGQRGLTFYAFFEVLNSSWIRSLERMNRVHPQHGPHHFANLRHFIATFHDSTFECVSAGMRVTLVENKSREAMVTTMMAAFEPIRAG